MCAPRAMTAMIAPTMMTPAPAAALTPAIIWPSASGSSGGTSAWNFVRDQVDRRSRRPLRNASRAESVPKVRSTVANVRTTSSCAPDGKGQGAQSTPAARFTIRSQGLARQASHHATGQHRCRQGFFPSTAPVTLSGRKPKKPPPVTKVWPVGSLAGSKWSATACPWAPWRT